MDFTNSIHLRLGEYPNSIDLINQTIGIDLKNVFKRGIIINLDDLPCKIIHLDDLIANKKALNTFKDLADAEELVKIRDKKT